MIYVGQLVAGEQVLGFMVSWGNRWDLTFEFQGGHGQSTKLRFTLKPDAQPEGGAPVCHFFVSESNSGVMVGKPNRYL